jgi:hypothetical protein
MSPLARGGSIAAPVAFPFYDAQMQLLVLGLNMQFIDFILPRLRIAH